METSFTMLEKTMLVNAHPVKMSFNVLGLIVGCYFLWINDGLNALIFGVGLVLIGTVLSLSGLLGKFDPKKLAETRLGKYHMNYTTKLGLTLYLFSHVLFPYAFWAHNLYLIMLSIVLLLIGAVIYKNVKK